jgi:glycerol-3-phosphate dehydrogenase (NAD(P)+)
MKLRIGLLGGGSWGTTVASMVARNSPTIMWARSNEVVDEINKNHSNEKYLPNAKLTHTLFASTSIEETIRDADVVVVGVPSHSFRQVLQDAKPFIRPWLGAR